MKRINIGTAIVAAIAIGMVFLGTTDLGAAQSAALTAGTPGTLTISISPAPGLSQVLNPANPTAACLLAAGTVISQLSTIGGDGNPVTYALTSGDTTDFAVNGSTVVVGPAGIALANCGKVETAVVTPSQQ